MKLTLRQLCLGAVVLGALGTPLVTALVWTDPPQPDPRAGLVWISGPFIHLGGNAWQAIPPKQFDAVADTGETPNRSPFVLLENEKPIGPAHSRHSDIIEKGSGRYSHWRSPGGAAILIFSATDNTDPNRNWKRYSWKP